MVMPGTLRHRGDRFPDAGCIFRITMFTERRVRHLKPFPVARAVVRALRASDAEALTDTLAFAVLPDQVQWLFVLRDFTTLSRPVRAVKAHSAEAIVPLVMLPGPLWQPAFAEERIGNRAAAEAAATEVVEAPLRAGHAPDPHSWPHWDTSLDSVLARFDVRT